MTKNSIRECFNRTFSEKLFRYFDAKHERNWVDVSQDIIDSYNATYHRTIGVAPNEVSIENSVKIYKRLYGVKLKKREGKLKVGDIVRVSRIIDFKDKSYENRWSRAVFEVSEGPFYSRVVGTIPMYKVREVDTKIELPGKYYETELYRVDRKIYYEDFTFPIEKKLCYRTKNNRREVLVK